MADEKITLLPEIEQLTEKLLADPKSRVFAQLADAYRKCGMFDEAIDTAKKGLEIHPKYAVAHLILGRCYMAKKMYALAREEFELTVRNDPQNLVGFRLLAETYERQNMYPEAAKYYQMVLDLDPTNIDIAEKVENLKGAIRPEPAFQQPEPEPTAAPEPAARPVPEPAEPAPAPEATADPKSGTIAEQAPEAPSMTAPSPAIEEPGPDILQGLQQALEIETAQPTEAALPSGQELPQIPDEKPPVQGGTAVADEQPAGATATLAELYASQGHFEKAVEAYRQLVANEPENQAHKQRMDELLAKLYPDLGPVQEPGEPAAPAAAEIPAPPSAASAESQGSKPAEDQAVELTGMFAEMEKLAAVAEPGLPPPAPEEAPKLESVFSLGGEAPKAGSEPAAVSLSDLFAEETPAPNPVEGPTAPAAKSGEPAPAQEKDEPKENAVSSFQSWLNSIQK